MSKETERSTRKLVRGLSLLDATMIVIGSMIGSGIFLTSAESARLVGAPGWLLAAWVLGGVLTITGALCCAELAAMMPRAGGQYVFLREAYSPSTGFLFGWALFLVIQTGTIAAVAVAFARFLGVLTKRVATDYYIIAPQRITQGYALSLSTEQLVAVALILLLTLTNTRGLKTGKLIQNTFTFTKTAALAGLILVGLIFGWNEGSAGYTSSWWDSWANGWSAQAAQPGLGATGYAALLMLLGLAMTGPLFAQSAWNNVTFTGSEVSNPGRNLPRALLFGCGAVVVLYLLANLAYVLTLPLAVIQKPPNSVATATMQTVLGRPGSILMAVAIMVSTFGCNNGLILAGARVYYAMARDRLFFERVGSVNRAHVPAVALVAQGVWASLLTLPRTVAVDSGTGAITYGNVYNQLLEYIIPADLVFYALMVGAVIVMRRKAPEAERPYRTFGYPVVPIVYMLLAALLIFDLVYLKPRTSGFGFLIVLTGIPIYLIWRWRNAAIRSAVAVEQTVD
ncbi:MAG TPA: amino acid permease [Pyrinomonadaceae bacterium]|jgi:APA family basic amino acid/polyamine antiporter|nr:amino acid permease [Pyrinomonadaceae bacterium]